ncbi:amino acid adenylation domain-containing protein [Streptomyces sp. NPDC005865]|uniref:amino acid adenylation domain-containing protein n=1 Tax=Streptomyces sp. NPDC005865 TaxID=3155453 RepID=UPI0033D8C9DC
MPQPASEVSGHPHSPLIHASVAHQARVRPDAVAIVQGDERVTYRELAGLTAAYAAALSERGVRPGQHIPVVMTRSPRYVAAVLAVLTCGAAYATLDARWPQRRLHGAVERLRAPLAVADVPLDLPVPVWTPARRDRTDAPRVACRPDDAATVFFTSGTTGEPKGVVTPHRATTRLFGPGTFADFGPGHVTAGGAALHWDAASLEIWGPLSTGGTVALVEDHYLTTPALARMVRDQGVDTLWLTASLFNAFVDECLPVFEGLRHVLTGGERLSPHHVRLFLRAHPTVRLTNGYGPVESCVFVTTHRVGPADCERGSGVPIGRAVPGTRVHVLDGARPCRPGETGEICVSGEGLALGYLDDAEKSAAHFPVRRVEGQDVRLYATGDLGFTTDDGTLHYVGRVDRQVKVRGHRIEPAAVEEVALSLPWVGSAVAVPVRGDGGAYDSVVLFCAAAPAVRPREGVAEVRTLLAGTLPPYSVPDRVELVDAIPLTPQGKADFRALLAGSAHGPHAAEAGGTTAYSPNGVALPGYWDSLALAEFRSLFGSGVRATSTLISLGGTSLDAIRLCSRLSSGLERPLSVAQFLLDPTPTGLARLLSDAHRRPPTRAAVSPSPPLSSGTGVPLTPQQAAFVLQHELDPSDSSTVCPLLWHVRGPLDVPALERALNDVQRRHESLRTVYRLAPHPVAEVGDGAVELRVEFPAGTAGPQSADDARSLVEETLLRPFALGRGEIWRCVYAPVNEREGFLGIGVHHVAVDGWSQALLLSEITRAHRARARGRSPRFRHPAPTLGEIHEECLRAGRPGEDGVQTAYWRAQTAYWKELLTGIPDLSAARPGPGGCEAAEAVEFVVGPEVTARIRAVAAAAGSTDFTALLACYAEAVARSTGQRDFGIGVPVVRRPGPLSLRALSCLIDVLCLRLPLGDAARPASALLPAVRRAVEAAFHHQEASFSDVVRAVRPPQTGRNPLFQTMFAYQNTPPAPLRLGGCAVSPLRVAPNAAMHELSCEVWPLDGARLLIDIRHKPGHVTRETARTVAEHYRSLLVELGDRPC